MIFLMLLENVHQVSGSFLSFIPAPGEALQFYIVSHGGIELGLFSWILLLLTQHNTQYLTSLVTREKSRKKIWRKRIHKFSSKKQNGVQMYKSKRS